MLKVFSQSSVIQETKVIPDGIAPFFIVSLTFTLEALDDIVLFKLLVEQTVTIGLSEPSRTSIVASLHAIDF